MSTDTTESARRAMVNEINSRPASAAEFAAAGIQTWDTDELCNDFEVIGFSAPFVVVRRKADGVKGSLKFQHSPRLYFEFNPA